MWEAIVRLLHVILDCDEITTLEEAERFWLEWYQKKMSQETSNILVTA
jgi:hypothetical protein